LTVRYLGSARRSCVHGCTPRHAQQRMESACAICTFCVGRSAERCPCQAVAVGHGFRRPVSSVPKCAFGARTSVLRARIIQLWRVVYGRVDSSRRDRRLVRRRIIRRPARCRRTSVVCVCVCVYTVASEYMHGMRSLFADGCVRGWQTPEGCLLGRLRNRQNVHRGSCGVNSIAAAR
jgi:hypothetical protein